MGEFQRAGDQLWVTARIVDVETGMIRENVSIEGWLGPSSAMRVGFPTAGPWFSYQWRPDNEFETDRWACDASGECLERPCTIAEFVDMYAELIEQRHV